jgi:nucleoside-diphosphate-sugar epimerase
MKILITGASGFAGKFLVSYFAKLGHEIFATYRKTLGFPFPSESQITWIQVDIGQVFLDLDSVDVIIHAAAVHPFSRKPPSSIDYITSNIQSTAYLAEFAQSCSVKLFVYLSSISVHGTITTPLLSEDTPLSQPDLYGVSKYTSERILEKYKHVFPTVVLRLPGLVGPKYERNRLWLATVLQKALEHQPIAIFNKDHLFNNVTDVFDLGRGILFLINQWKSGFEIFNLASRKPIPLIEVVEQIRHLSHSQSAIVEKNTSQQSFHVNIEKFQQQLYFEPDMTESIIERFVLSNLN